MCQAWQECDDSAVKQMRSNRRLATLSASALTVGAVGMTIGAFIPSASGVVLAPKALPNSAAANVKSDAALPPVPALPTLASVGTAAEAWFDLPFTCTLPIGCLPVPNLLPAGTLHIGVIAGETTAETALKLDTASLPKGATITGGTLNLPLDTAPTALSLSPDKAGFKACLLTADFKAGEGLSVAAPASDCTVSNPANYDKAGSKYTIDLQPFLQAWSSGKADHGILLVPFSTAATDHSTWQVALFSSTVANAASKITAALNLSPAVSADAASSASPAPAASTDTTSPTTPAATTPSADTGGASTVPAATDTTAPVPQVAAPAAATSNTAVSGGFAGKGYAYPIVWALPIAVLAGCAWVGRLLTKDLSKGQS